VGEPSPTPARILNALGLVGASLALSYFAIDTISGLLQIAEAPVQVQRAVLLLLGTSLAIGQWPVTSALARRLRTTLIEHPLVTGCSYLASGMLLVFVALLVR